MTIEIIWNIIYYSAYKIDYKLHMGLRNISPIRLLLRIPVLNRLLLRRGGSNSSILSYCILLFRRVTKIFLVSIRFLNNSKSK